MLLNRRFRRICLSYRLGCDARLTLENRYAKIFNSPLCDSREEF